MSLDKHTLRKLLEIIALTRPDEIECDSCYAELDRFAEMLVAGKDPNTILPLVRHHLEICGACSEEFDALLKTLNPGNNGSQ